MSLNPQKSWYCLLVILCTWDILYTVFKQTSLINFQSMELIKYLPEKFKFVMDSTVIISDKPILSTEINQPDSHMGCHLPVLDPFHKSVRRHLGGPVPINCSAGKYPLLFTTDLDSSLIQLQDPLKYGYEDCCYQKFVRRSDKKITYHSSQCELIHNRKTLIPKGTEFIRVRCSKIRMKLNNSSGGMAGAIGSTVVTIDYFGFVHLKPQLEERIGNLTIPGNKKREIFPGNQESSIESVTTHRRLNVVLFGLDAVSHMNFIRVMPLTHKYLTQNLSAFGFNGYVKVADNTFPNLVPFLTGKSVKELRNTCWENPQQRFDKCPFTWKNYSAHGFRTAYSEDEVWMSTFNYHKHGFTEQPVDYYFNTFLHQLGRRLGHHRLINTNYCYGPRPGMDLSLNFLRQMAYTMNKTRPYFQFTWSNAATHDMLNYGKLGDKVVAETLAWFKSGGFFENTALILLSDHGLRWGLLRSSFQGRMEERMPFLYFILPQWFTLKYPKATRSLWINRNKMTTPFDLHETLLDLLDLGRTSSDTIVKRNAELSKKQELPRGISLFLPIPARRTCNDAHIAEHYCVCTTLKSIPVENNTLIREAAENIVSSINSFLIISKSRKCSTLSLDKIFNAQIWQSAQSRKTSPMGLNRAPKRKNKKVTYTVSFSVSPSNATFEATSTRYANGSWEISGRASRTNLYGNESRCVTDPILKLYCYCGTNL